MINLILETYQNQLVL